MNLKADFANCFIWFYIIFFKEALAGRPTTRGNSEGRLHRYVTSRYDASTRPVINATTVVSVRFSVTLNQIMDLVEKNQTLVTHLWIHEQWYDELLRWDASDFDGLDLVVLSPDFLWVPDIFLFNNADKGKEGFMQLNESKVMIHSSGRVDWILPVIVKSSCGVDVTYFPFDVQECFLRFGSWIYDSSQVDITINSTTVDLSAFITDNELDLIHSSLERKIHTYGHLKYPQVLMHLHLRRKPLYYAYTIVGPTLVLCILTLFSYWLPCDHGGKVGIGLTVFLSLYVLQLAVAENIPESNSMPLISIFIIMVMTLNAVSLLLATVIINIKQIGDKPHCPKVPWVLFILCKNFIAKITCTSLQEEDKFANVRSCDSPTHGAAAGAIQETSLSQTRATTSTLCDHGSPWVMRRYSRPKADDTENNDEEDNSQGMAVENVRLRIRKENSSDSADFYQSSDDVDSTDINTSTSQGRPTVALSSPRRRRRLANQKKYEWYFVAECIDKFLFAFYLFGMSLTITTLLVIIPAVHVK